MRTYLCSLFVLSACTAPVEPETLLAHGPFQVGYEERSVTYDPGNGERELRLALFYPTEATTGANVRYDGLYPGPGVLGGAPMAAGPFPLVVSSHGHQGFAEASAQIVQHLVSHGYVVAAPDHTNNTTFDGDNRTTEIYWQRPADLGAVIDAMAASDLPLTDDPIVAVGHSFGGYTLEAMAGATFDPARISACLDGEDTPFCSTMTPDQADRFEAGLADPRIAGILAMAPGDHRLFGDAGLQAIEVPTLLMTGGEDNVEQGDLQWGGLAREGNFRAHLPMAGHTSFTDFRLDSGSMDPELAWSVVGAYHVAFVRHVHGDRAVRNVFDGSDVLGPDTVFTAP